jgi:hypothetical protein
MTVYQTGTGKLPPEMQIVRIAEETGWTLTEIRQQPAWFMALVSLNVNAKTDAQNREIKRQERRSGKKPAKKRRK